MGFVPPLVRRAAFSRRSVRGGRHRGRPALRRRECGARFVSRGTRAVRPRVRCRRRRPSRSARPSAPRPRAFSSRRSAICPSSSSSSSRSRRARSSSRTTAVLGSLFANALLVLGLAIVAGAWHARTGSCGSAAPAERHGDAPAAGGVHHRPARDLARGRTTPRAATRSRSPRSARSRCSACTRCGSGATCARRAPRRARARASAHGRSPSASRCAPGGWRASAPRSSPTGSSTRSARRSNARHLACLHRAP